MLSAKEQGKSTQHEKKLNAQAKVRLDDGKGPVSYTHLDVYKRQTADTLTVDAHPCEGPGSDPQDFLPDDRAWGSRTPPPIRS